MTSDTPQRLRDVETRLQLALAASDMGVWTWDIIADRLEWATHSGAAWGQLIANVRSFADIVALIHPDDRIRHQAALEHAMDPNGSGHYRAEFRILHETDANEHWIILDARTEFDDGRPVRMIGVMRDATARFAALEAARRSEERLSGIVSIAADAIISIDEDYHITLFNKGAEAIFGYSSDEVMGRPLETLLPERYRATHSGHIRMFANSGVHSRLMGERRSIFGLRKDGSEFPAEASISRLEIGRQRTYTVVLRDITARKRAEEALAQANQDLEARVAERTRELSEEMTRREQAQAALAKSQRMEAFGQLTGGIAHDFNNLLTVIAGNHELLEMRLQDEKALTLLKRAQAATEMGARLTARLLTFARRRHLEPKLLNLNEQMTGMVELLRRSIGEHVTLTTNLEPRLWTVRADASEVENAVLNLAINARDAMPSGGTLVIETANCTFDRGETGGESRLPPGEYVRLAVSDNGTGMSPEVLARAFEPFFTTKSPGKGTGLGLSTIYGFVQQSGGTVTAYSEIGRGTTINIYLPRTFAATADSKAERNAEAVPHGAGETVLVVEDNADVREVVRQRLEGLGYVVQFAENGPVAIALLKRSHRDIALVFSDIVMPGGLTGYDIARWIILNAPSIKVLLTSGYPDEVASIQDPSLRSVRLLRKPHSGVDLARALHAALHN